MPDPPGLDSWPHRNISCKTHVTAALRAPVLVVRLDRHRRPGRSTRAPRAECRSCRRHDVAGSSEEVNFWPSSKGSALLGTGRAPG